MDKSRRQKDILFLLTAILMALLGSFGVRQSPDAYVALPWALLGTGAAFGGVTLRNMTLWLPDASPAAVALYAGPSRPRWIVAWVSFAMALVLTGWGARSLYLDSAGWRPVLWAWLAALLLMLIGAFSLRIVGEASSDFAPHLQRTREGFSGFELPKAWEIGLFVAILSLGIFLRLYRLDEIPAAIYVDETNASLDALHILEGRETSPFGTGWYETPNGYIYYMAALYKLFGVSYWTLKAASLIPALLTIPLTFWLGRMLFGPLAGLVAMFMLSISRWHMTLSRWGWNELMPPLFQIVGIAFLIRGLRERRALDFVVGGLISGLTLYTYLSSRLVLLTLLVFTLYRLVSDPEGPRRAFQRHATGLVLFGAAALVAMTPLAVTYFTNPFLFFNRSAEISIFRDVQDEGSWWPLQENIRRHIGMFHREGDPVGRQNLPGEPQTDPMTGALMAVGFAYAALTLRDRRCGLLWLWFGVAMAGGFLSELRVQLPNAPDYILAPNGYRTLTAVTAIALTVSAVVDMLMRGFVAVEFARSEQSSRPRGMGGALVVLILAFAAVWEVSTFFVRQAASPSVQLSFNQMETQVSYQVLDALEAGAAVYLSPNFYNFSPLRFLVYGAVHDDAAESPLTSPPYQLLRPEVDLPIPANETGALILLGTEYGLVTDGVTAIYPNAKVSLVSGPGAAPLFLRIWVPPQDLLAQQGLRLSILHVDGSREERRVNDFAWPKDDETVRGVTWQGSLRLTENGVYDFSLENGELHVDNTAWSGPRFLDRGRHDFRLTVDTPNVDVDPVLQWKTPSGVAGPLPQGVLFATATERRGLTGYYYANDSWQGDVLFQRVTPFLLMSWPLNEPVAHPFSATFRGSLRISTPGLYNFRLNADDGVRFLLAGQTLGESLTPDRPNRIQATLELTPDIYPIRIDYFQRYGGSALEFYWQPPGEPEAPVPPTVLIPDGVDTR